MRVVTNFLMPQVLPRLDDFPIASFGPPPPGMGRRSRPRSRYIGAKLREIRATGQARECARRRRQAEARS